MKAPNGHVWQYWTTIHDFALLMHQRALMQMPEKNCVNCHVLGPGGTVLIDHFKFFFIPNLKCNLLILE